MIRPVPAGLLVLAAVLAGTIGLELWSMFADDGAMIPSAPRLTLARPGPPAPNTAPALPRGVPTESLLARPLFAPTRRPAAVAARPDAPAAGLPRLAGVLMHGGVRSVIFAGTDGGRPVVVAEGGQVAGYVVQSIEPGRVTLAGPGGTRVLRPSFDPRPPAAAGAASVSAPAAFAPAVPFAAPGDIPPAIRDLPGFAGPAAAR